MYQLRISPKTAKFFKKIRDKKLKTAFKNALEHILTDPNAGELKTGDLSGIYCYDVYYDKVNIVIILAGTRENFYDEFKRLIS